MISTAPPHKFTNWFTNAPWRILFMGTAVALVIAVLLLLKVMQAPLNEVLTLSITMSGTAVFSLGLGYLLYRRVWTRSPSLTLTLSMTYVWATTMTLFNVWVMAQRMFINTHDLILNGVLLLFAAIIAITFGGFAAASVTDSLSRLDFSASQIANGDLGSRVQVTGRDEIASVGQTFNQMAAQLEEAAIQQAELEALRRDLIAWTSHDLRTPLTSVRAMVEALHDGVVDDPKTVQRYYRTIRADIIALNGLIDDLFELAQLDASGLKMDMEPASLTDIISDTLERFQPVAQRQNISLSGSAADDLDPVLLNAPKIGRVLANLVSNALRYVPPGGDILVTAAHSNGEVSVKVEDNGCGFDPEDLPRIFEQFYRGEQARSRKTGGAGLGLAIARGIVLAHNGRIWAENVKTGGAIVEFTIPRVHSHECISNQ